MRDHEYHRIFSCQTLIVNQTKSLGLHITSRVSVWSEAVQKEQNASLIPLNTKGCHNIGALERVYDWQRV